MRAIVVAMVAMLGSGAFAGDLEDAHRQAVSGRDSYWNCLTREYQRQDNRNMSGSDFKSLIARACPSERQSFRVRLTEYLALQFPDGNSGSHMTNANNAIGFAQKDVATAFAKH